MTVIRWAGFKGENRAVHPKLLAESLGTLSRNQKPGRGDLRPWNEPLTVASVPGGRQTIYRLGQDVSGDANYWLSWTGDVHVARVMQASDLSELTAYTGDGAPKLTNNVMLGTSSRPLGLPAPRSAPRIDSVVNPTPETIQEAVAASSYVLVSPRKITAFRSYNFSAAGVNQTSVFVYLAAGHGLKNGDIVTISLPSFAWANKSGTIGYDITLDTSASPDRLMYDLTPQQPSVVELTDTSGEVVADGDTLTNAGQETIYEQQVEETRFYAYTYVNDWGWESAPSAPSAQVDCYVGASVTVNGFASPPSGNYNVNRIRVYRTQTGSTSTDFFFVGEVSYGATSFTDSGQTLGETLPTNAWLPAPGIPTGGPANLTEPTLHHLTPMWNGMLAGISGNAVRFCEAYIPYAWPVAYDVVPSATPVALGVFGQSLLVLTNGHPSVVAGSGPDSLDESRLEFNQACIAPRSVVSMGSGVAWASPDGLCWYGTGGAKIITQGWLTREDWQAMNPASVVGCNYDGLYFGSYDNGSGRKGFVVDPSGQFLGFLDVGYSAMFFDKGRDQLYVLDGSSIKRWDAGGTAMTVNAKSKVWHTPYPTNFAVAEVLADAYPVTFKLHVDGAVKHTQTVANGNPFRLPSGFLAQEWQMEVQGDKPVLSAAIAHYVADLRSV